MIDKLVLSSLILILAGPVQAQEKLFFRAPTQIPRVTREMQTPGYWIGRVDSPDKILMDAAAIDAFNRRVRDTQGLTKDMTRTPEVYNGAALRHELRSRLESLKARELHGADAGFFAAMENALALDAVPEDIDIRYGVVTGYADQRFLPAVTGLYAVSGDIDFDELQNSALDIGTPVTILHESADRQWYYVISELSDGWVRSDRVALCPQPAFQKFASARDSPLVVTAAKADVYLNETLTEHYDHLRMGTILPATPDRTTTKHRVLLPIRNSAGRLVIRPGYIAAGKAAEGYLPFTPRVILEQAFKLLNTPYGWGGMYGEQDCSRFIQMVYATVGLRLPRDSGPQAKSGHMLARFDLEAPLDDKRSVLQGLIPGPVVLTMRGHIMLYLGSVDGWPYAIHSFWAYREPTPDGDRVRVVNRVAVSDLDLGEGSQKGSLLRRLTGVMDLRLEGSGSGDRGSE